MFHTLLCFTILIEVFATFQVVFTALLAVAAAAPGYIGGYAPYAAAPIAAGWGHGIVSAPLISAPVVKAAVPVATSYANTVKVSYSKEYSIL